MTTTSTTTIHELKPESELRVDIPSGKMARMKLIDGSAEVFGTELALGRTYTLNGAKIGVFSWYGGKIEVSGDAYCYVSAETPMADYMAVHHTLEERRAGGTGPRVMIMGPTDVGKSSVSKILLNYGVRLGHKVLYVDLDIGQGAVSVPGSITATAMDKPVDIEDGFDDVSPLAFFFGDVTPSANPELFKAQIEKLAECVDRRMEADPAVKKAGLVCNTCGWIDGLGQELLLHHMRALRIDLVVVLDSDRLANVLVESVGREAVVKLQKSGGIVGRDAPFRRVSRTRRIRDYFYGVNNDLSPNQSTVKFDDVRVFRIGGVPAAPSSALPLGSTPTLTQTSAVDVAPSEALNHHVLAVVHGENEEGLVGANAAGFVYVVKVDVAAQSLTLLLPCPGELPGGLLVAGNVQWLE